ncbi:MAG: hypothetical protein QOJ39_1065 [Candidatus Eremiobacteraeota bacterium]|jgi:hypothetical protein|nr:hypothetical protein [Candidatus Eremiobacteraeota bacterium]MEA2719201.1 hypothetical protein [Candidatus Eremiobacteraeota bacterium]
MLVRRIALALAVTLTPLASADAVEQSTGPLYVVVPFGDPGDTDPVLKHATQQLTVDLANKQIRTALSVPIDAIEAVGTARQMCGSYNADGVLVSQLRFEQSKERNLTGFIPIVGGVVSSSGMFDRSPIRASLRLYLIDCTGMVRWKTYTTANKVHKGQNVAAGLTEITDEAVAEAVDGFVNRPTVH